MSQRTGPCCSVSYKRMEEKDVVLDRTLLSEDVPVIQASCSNAISGSYNSVLKGSGLDNCVLFSLAIVSKLRGWVGNYRTCYSARYKRMRTRDQIPTHCPLDIAFAL